MAREYFCAYHSLLQSLTPYADAECGRLFRAALKYSMTGEAEKFSGSERFIWPTIQSMIDRDNEKYAEKCRQNAANVNARYERIRTNTEAYESYQEKEKEEDKVKEEVKKESKPKKGTRFTPPTVEEVTAYCQERGNNVNPQRFVDYYSSNGWMVGKNKMKDWRACVRTWEQKDGKKPEPKYPVVVPQDETDRLMRLTEAMNHE